MIDLQKQLNECKAASNNSLTNLKNYYFKKYIELGKNNDLRSISKRYDYIELVLMHISVERKIRKLNI